VLELALLAITGGSSYEINKTAPAGCGASALLDDDTNRLLELDDETSNKLLDEDETGTLLDDETSNKLLALLRLDALERAALGLELEELESSPPKLDALLPTAGALELERLLLLDEAT
jgi:hypothetical protein